MTDTPVPVTKWNVGDRVELIEDTGSTGATVLEVANIMRGDDVFEISYRVAYDEGGEGWWPESALKGEEEEPDEEEPESEEEPETEGEPED